MTLTAELQDISISLTLQEAELILNILGEMPTKTNIYPLALKISDQAKSQLDQQSINQEKDND